MSYDLKITLSAKKTFDQNLDYLKKEWGAKVTNEFINRVEVVLNTISENPFLYPFSFHIEADKAMRSTQAYHYVLSHFRQK